MEVDLVESEDERGGQRVVVEGFVWPQEVEWWLMVTLPPAEHESSFSNEHTALTFQLCLHLLRFRNIFWRLTKVWAFPHWFSNHHLDRKTLPFPAMCRQTNIHSQYLRSHVLIRQSNIKLVDLLEPLEHVWGKVLKQMGDDKKGNGHILGCSTSTVGISHVGE